MTRNKAVKRMDVLFYLAGVGNCFIAINETSIFFIRQCRTKGHNVLIFKKYNQDESNVRLRIRGVFNDGKVRFTLPSMVILRRHSQSDFPPLPNETFERIPVIHLLVCQ